MLVVIRKGRYIRYTETLSCQIIEAQRRGKTVEAPEEACKNHRETSRANEKSVMSDKSPAVRTSYMLTLHRSASSLGHLQQKYFKERPKKEIKLVTPQWTTIKSSS